MHGAISNATELRYVKKLPNVDTIALLWPTLDDAGRSKDAAVFRKKPFQIKTLIVSLRTPLSGLFEPTLPLRPSDAFDLTAVTALTVPGPEICSAPSSTTIC